MKCNDVYTLGLRNALALFLLLGLSCTLRAEGVVDGCIHCHGPEGRALMPGGLPLTALGEDVLAAKLRGYRAQLITDSTMAKVAHDLDDSQIQEAALWFARDTLDTGPDGGAIESASAFDRVWLERFFLYGALVNWAILLYWLVMVKLFRRWIYSIWGRFFDISEAELDRFNFYAMALYKLLIMTFFFVPWLVLLLIH